MKKHRLKGKCGHVQDQAIGVGVCWVYGLRTNTLYTMDPHCPNSLTKNYSNFGVPRSNITPNLKWDFTFVFVKACDMDSNPIT